MDNYPSKLLENAVVEFAKLPGIGKKTAMRLVLHLLKCEKDEVALFSSTLMKLRNEVMFCSVCNNISDNEVCSVCADSHRDRSLICVVESIRDVMSIENTRQYNGLYHVLGGIISPMNGIGPSDLKVELLEQRAASGSVAEIILALSTTMEGDTTNFYLYRKLAKYGVRISTIARGVSVGDELEYTDEVTLGRSIINRTPFETIGS